MQKKQIKRSMNIFGKKFLAVYLMTLMLLTSFVGLVPLSKAEPLDVITTYNMELSPTMVFDDEALVLINASVNNTRGDPEGPPYTVKAINENSSEWVYVGVMDNNTMGPWGGENREYDSIYWGVFQINSTDGTHNGSEMSPSVLHVENGNTILITEEYPGPFDGDEEVESTVITAMVGPPPGGQGNGTVCGFVEDMNHTGIQDATVHLDGAQQYFSHTNESGFYIFNNNVSANHYQTEVLIEGQSPFVGQEIDVIANQTRWQNFTIEESQPNGTATVCGYVEEDGSENSIENALVTIENFQINLHVFTNQTGFYTFDHNISDGDYNVTAEKLGFEPCTFNHISAFNDQTTWQNFSLSLSGGGGGQQQNFSNITYQGFIYQDFTPKVPVEDAFITIETFGNPSDILGSDTSGMDGSFEIIFLPNSSAVENGTMDVTIRITKEGYEDWDQQRGLSQLVQMEMEQMQDELFILKIWDITCLISGYVYNETITPLEHVMIFAEGDDYFQNNTETAGDGSFTVGTITGDICLWISKNGYFMTQVEVEAIFPSVQVDDIHLDLIPPYTSNIIGQLTSGGEPLPYTDLMLYDPAHPFTVKQGMPPITNATGYFNISTYAGHFYLVTMAKIIGMQMEGPPLGIGGYVNQVVNVTIADHEIKTFDIDLEASDPDELLVDINVTSWNESTVTMQRTITGNAPLIRLLADSDLDGTVSAEEATVIIGDVTDGLSDSMMFSEINMLITFPFGISIDEQTLMPGNVSVEVSGLSGTPSGILAPPDPIIFYVNGTYMIDGEINEALLFHSVQADAYYSNPAFTESYTIAYPDGWTVWNARQELVSFEGLGESTVTISAATDPDINDTTFYEPVSMFVGTADAFAAINPAYSFGIPIDTDADGKYNFLQRKIKFNTTQAGTFGIKGELRTTAGIPIDDDYMEKSYGTGSNIVELWFEGEKIYISHENGPYKAVVDLYYVYNGTSYWFDSLNQTTNNYSYDAFDSPPIYFTGTITDYGLDNNENGLYDYLVFDVEVDVGETGYYEFEGDVGLTEGGQGSDPHIAHLRKTTTFATSGVQDISMNVDGYLINEKGRNSSLWFNIWVRSPQYGQLDQINYMTEKYFCDQFELPPPENSSVYGNVTDVFGDALSAMLQLRNLQSWSENSTATNETTGAYCINAAAGAFELNAWATGGGQYDWCNELVILEEEQDLLRNIKLLPPWHLTERLNIWMDQWQYAAGDIIYLNGSVSGSPLPDSPAEITIYREIDIEQYHGRVYVATENTVTDGSSTFRFTVDTTGYTNGDYRFEIAVYNQTQQRVCRDDRWLQISSFNLDFHLDKSNYRPGTNGTGTFNLTYMSNFSWVRNASYEWKILYYDWAGEHIVTSGSFISASGHGAFVFMIPSNIDPQKWYDFRLTASKDDSEVSAGMGFGIVTGTCIADASDSAVGTPPDCDGLFINVTIDVTQAGSYRISGGLHGQNWEFITGNETLTGSLSVGSHVIPLYFEGEQIQERGIDPYRAWIGLFRDWNQLDSMDYVLTQTYYSYQFAQPATRFDTEIPLRIIPIGTENDYDALNISCNITSSIPGTYRVEGNLHKQVWQGGYWEWYPVAWSQTEIEITALEVNQSMNCTLHFEGNDIYNSMQTGPWNTNLNLFRVPGEWITVWDPEEEINYSYDQFTKPAAYFEGIIDQGANENGDLRIDVQVNVSQGYEGMYEINGNLHSNNQYGHMWITQAWNQTTLTNGTNTIPLIFSGEAIYSAGFNGTYLVWVELRRLDPWEWLGGREFETDSHTYDEFSTPSAMFVGNHTDEGYDEDGDGYYNYLRVTVPVSFSGEGHYEIQGDLYKQIGYEYRQISWGHAEVQVAGQGEQNIIVDFSGFEIRNKEIDGYYGINLRLRDFEGGGEINRLEYTTDTYYYWNDFEMPAVQFTDNSPLSDELNPDGNYINVTLQINSSEVGTYHVMGDLHKVINQGGWQQWIWITHSEKTLIITEPGTVECVVSFDTAMIQASGYNGPYTINFRLMDDTWMTIDTIDDYQTQAYQCGNFSPVPVQFTGGYDDYLSPSTHAQYVKVNVSLQVNESGFYHIDGCLHKQIGWNWNHLAGYGTDQYLTASNSTQNVTLQFDVIEIYTNIQNLGLQGQFDQGRQIDIEAWLRRAGQWNDLDQLSVDSKRTYYTSDFASTAISIVSIGDNGYNETGNNETPPYDYLNLTVTLNFTVAGDYEIWSDLNKQSGTNWYWLGWTNSIITVTANDLAAHGYYEEEVTLQFSGRLLADYDAPYRYHMELRNLSTGRREAMREGELTGYSGSDFRGSSVTFVEETIDDEGIDSDDPDSQYNSLRISVDVSAQQQTDIILQGDLHKEDGGWQWIAWEQNWTTIDAGTTPVTLDFDGQSIYGSGVNGPYQVRLEIRDSSNWELLDVIERYNTNAYTYDNFQTPGASFGTITDWGNDTDSDGEYNYLEVNVSVDVTTEGSYEIWGDLHSDMGGWYWLGSESSGLVSLPEGTSIVKLQFDGVSIRNSGRNGPYKIRFELRDSEFTTMDMVDPYTTDDYLYTQFQRSGVELIENETCPSDSPVGTPGSYDYLQLNVTVNCSVADVNYWIGADLHKESGWQWQWIDFQGQEFTSELGVQTIPILFSGELIRNSEINGPYDIRIELRDTATWTQQDMIQRYTTQSYSYTNFKVPSVAFVEPQSGTIDWGNDTDIDGKYNFLDLNITIDCTQAGTYWLHGDLHKQTGWQWQPISWEGREITLAGTGPQEVKLQFSGEQIYGRGINGPYQVRLELNNISTGRRYDVIEQYTTQTYTYTQFQSPDIEFVEDENSPSDYGVGTQGSYTALAVNYTLTSDTGGTFWIGADLHKRSGWNWIPITWQSQEITHTGSGEETFTILFDGNLIRSSGQNGPYEIRFELRDPTTWNLLDFIDDYQTAAYIYSDFQSAGIELVTMTDGSADSIVSGNLHVDGNVDSSTTGTYEVSATLFKQQGSNWWYITWDSTQITVDDSGVQPFTLEFDGGEIYQSGRNGPYQIHFELRKVGTWTLVDVMDGYDTNTYAYSDFVAPTAGINTTADSVTSEYLQVNVTTFSNTSNPVEYQISGGLFDENWTFIAWDDHVQTIQGFDQTYTLQFDGNIINNSHHNPAKVYIEMRRTSDWKLIDSYETVFQNPYHYDNFTSGVEINISSVDSYVKDIDNDTYYDYLNVTLNITFSTSGIYEISAGLTNQNGTWITGARIAPTAYDNVTPITIPFKGINIYSRGLNGPYRVAFISVAKNGTGEIARANNINIPGSYSFTEFEHPDANATLAGTYSSYGWDLGLNGDYEYLVINVTVDVGIAGTYDFYGDLYTEDGSTWITGDNVSGTLTTGQHTVQLIFEGSDIYHTFTDGPYLLGNIWVGANVSGQWILLDSQSNAHTTDSYDYDDFNDSAQTPLVPSDVQSVSVSNDPFSPNSDGSKDTTLVTVTATAGQTLYVNIYNNTNVIKRTGLPLSGIGTSYTATWNGKDDSNTVVADGTYRIKVTDEPTGDPGQEATETTTVVVDTVAPTGATVTINSGASYTNTTSVTLSLTATDTSNKKMRFKNNGETWTDWEDFQSSKSWTLRTIDGTRTVYYQVKDVADNIATAVTDTIILDTVKPANVTITISGSGDTPTTHSNSVSVTLAIAAEDATSGLYKMMIANDVTFSGRSWETYSTSKEWTLSSGDGTKTVYLKVKDNAGLIADVVSDNITLDTTAPTSLTVSIASGQTYTNNTNVTLTLSATGAAKMRFSRNGTSYTSWETYATTKAWTLLTGDGTKTVYFQVKDTAGNIANNVTDTIILDTTAPTLSGVTSGSISQTGATISWTTNEASTSQVQYGLTTSYGSTTTLDETKVTSHAQPLSSLSPGTTYHYRVKSRDTAGNLGTSTDNTFTTSSGTDTTPPAAISGLTVTDKVNAEKTLTLSWTGSSASDFAAYKVYRRTSSFTNVTLSGVTLITTITSKTTTTYDDTTATDDTTFYYAVTAIDTASPPNENKTVTSVSGTSRDDKAPTTTDNIPVGWQTSEVTVTLTATDYGKGVNKTYYTTNGSNPQTLNGTLYSAPFTVGGENELGDGQWTIKYYSYDKNTTPNLESVHTKTLKVDTAKPATTNVTSPVNAHAGWKNTSVTVTLSATDATSGVYKIFYTTDTSTPGNASSQYTTPLLFSSPGTTTLKYRAKDNATNMETTKTLLIRIDITLPTSSVTPLSTYSTSPFAVSWTSSDTPSGVRNVTIQVKNGTGGTWTNWLTGQTRSGTAYYTGSNGCKYYFRSIARDNASNVETAYTSTGDTSTTVASSVPTADISSPSDNDGDGIIYVRATVTFTGNATDANFSKYWLNYSADGILWVNIANSTSAVVSSTLGTWNTTALTEMAYNISLKVKNIAGVANYYNLTNVIVDNTAPDITAVDETSVTSSAATITWTTDEAANSTVQYGTTQAYGSTASVSTFVTSHSVPLSGLSASTTYHYRVISYDHAGNMNNSADGTFTTEASTSPPGGPGGGEPEGGDEPPVITDVSHDPTIITSHNYVTIYATVTDDNNVTSVTLHWNDGSPYTALMELRENDIYLTEIGPFPDGTTVTYYIEAEDDAEQITTSSTNTFMVIDSAPPTISGLVPNSGTMIADRKPMIQARYSDTGGINQTSVTIVVDGIDVTAQATISATQVRYTPIIPMSYDLHTVTVTVADTSRNSASRTWTFTIQEVITLVNETIENITAGETKTLSLEGTDTGIDEITFTARANLDEISITVQKLAEIPEGITPPDGTVFAYLSIDTTASETDISSWTIKFKVQQSWLTEHNIDKHTMILMRYASGEWQELTTIIVNENTEYVYYEAVTPGFSTFAIASNPPAGAVPPSQILSIVAIIAAIIAVFVVLVMLSYRKRT